MVVFRSSRGQGYSRPADGLESWTGRSLLSQSCGKLLLQLRNINSSIMSQWGRFFLATLVSWTSVKLATPFPV